MLAFIIKGVIDSNNLPGMIGGMLISIGDNIANGNETSGRFHLINGIIVSIAIVDPMQYGTDNITIIIESKKHL